MLLWQIAYLAKVYTTFKLFPPGNEPPQQAIKEHIESRAVVDNLKKSGQPPFKPPPGLQIPEAGLTSFHLDQNLTFWQDVIVMPAGPGAVANMALPAWWNQNGSGGGGLAAGLV